MKKTLLIITLILFSIKSFSQETTSTTPSLEIPESEKLETETPTPNYWRTLTFTNIGGVTLDGSYLNTFSATLSYELKNGYTLNNWTGFNYNWAYDGGWISSQTTLTKKVKKFDVGAGFMYNNGSLITPFNSPKENISIIFSISKTFKLN